MKKIPAGKYPRRYHGSTDGGPGAGNQSAMERTGVEPEAGVGVFFTWGGRPSTPHRPQAGQAGQQEQGAGKQTSKGKPESHRGQPEASTFNSFV